MPYRHCEGDNPKQSIVHQYKIASFLAMTAFCFIPRDNEVNIPVIAKNKAIYFVVTWFVT